MQSTAWSPDRAGAHSSISVIAHRGASGYLPEHTLEAKALAYGQGADFLEQDVVATRDGTLVVLHDIVLEHVTDVATRFPARRRADGHYYVVDFDIDEIRQLVVVGRDRRTGGLADSQSRMERMSRYRVPTLSEELALVLRLNTTTGRSVGVYPEIKQPQWHRSHGIDLTRLLVEQLDEFGFRYRRDHAYVQCFDAEELRRVRDELGCDLALIQLVDSTATYQQLLSRQGLADLSKYVQGIGPDYHQLLETGGQGSSPRAGPLLHQAREHGLLLHPYTFKRESLPSFATSLESLLEFFYQEIGVNGVFCDFPDVAVSVRAAMAY